MKSILANALHNEKPYAVVLLVGGFVHLFFALSYVASTELIATPILGLGMSLLFFVAFLINTDSPLTQLHKEALIYVLAIVQFLYIVLSGSEDQPLLLAHFYPFFLCVFEIRRWKLVAIVYGVIYSVLLLINTETISFGTLDYPLRLFLVLLYVIEVLLIIYFDKRIFDTTKELEQQLAQANIANKKLIELFGSVVMIARDAAENLAIITKDLEDVVFVDEKYTKSLRGCAMSLSSIYEQYLLTTEQNDLSRFNVHNFLVSLVRSNFSEFMQEFVPKYTLDENIPPEVVGNSKRLADAVNQAIQDRLWMPIHHRLPFEIKTTYLGAQEVKYVLVQLRCGSTEYPDAKELQQKRSEELEDLLGVRLFTKEDDKGIVVSFFLHILEDLNKDVPGARPQVVVGMREINVDYESAKNAISSLRVLIAEDNDINQKVMTFLLSNYVASIEVVPDGRKLLQKLNEQSYDLILTDVQMPHINGIQATRHIREVENVNGGHIPIIALTAYSQPGERERCIKAGMDEFLCKPFDDEHLVMLMASVLEKAVPYRKDVQYQF